MKARSVARLVSQALRSASNTFALLKALLNAVTPATSHRATPLPRKDAARKKA